MNPDQLIARLTRLGTTLTARQIATLAAAFVAVVGVVAGSAYWASAPSYTLLYADLDPESASAVVTKLKAANTPYMLEQGGRAVLVPDTRVDELRLSLASEGLPTSGRIGLEIFDRTTFGTTEFLEHVNYRRGLEGELARTISTISEVSSARVHIALAKESVFTSSTEQAKASVVLKLRNNRPLAPSTIAGIAGLVAASVESLRPESVVIVDTFGRPLSKTPTEEDEVASGQGLERQQRIERDLTIKMLAMLEPVVGVGRVRVNVSAPLKVDREEQTEERFDPETAVVRSRTSSNDTVESTVPRDASGTRSNVPPELSTAAGAAPAPPSQSLVPSVLGKTTETTSYEISKVTRHTVSPSGAISRLSVAVVVDDARVPKDDGAGFTNKPREPAEIERIKGIVSAAVGYNAERGDQITVENIAFEDVTDTTPPEPDGPWWTRVGPAVYSALGVSVGDVLRWGLVSILALVALLAVIRPVVRSTMSGAHAAAVRPLPSAAGVLSAPRTVAELEGEMAANASTASRSSEGRVPALTRRIAAQADEKPEHVAQLVRAMLAQDEK